MQIETVHPSCLIQDGFQARIHKVSSGGPDPNVLNVIFRSVFNTLHRGKGSMPVFLRKPIPS